MLSRAIGIFNFDWRQLSRSYSQLTYYLHTTNWENHTEKSTGQYTDFKPIQTDTFRIFLLGMVLHFNHLRVVYLEMLSFEFQLIGDRRLEKITKAE